MQDASISQRRIGLISKGLAISMSQIIASVVILFVVIVIYRKIDDRHDITDFIKSLNSASRMKEIAISWRKTVIDNFYPFFVGFCIIYVTLQAISIPGTSVMNALAGYFSDSSARAWIVGCTCASIGSSCCYLLSWYFGKRYFLKWINSDRVRQWKVAIHQHQDHMFFYFVFLRVTPIIPNMVVNMASPHFNIPLKMFFFGTFFGVMPMTWIQLQAGILLEEWASDTFSLWNQQNILLVTLVSLVVLLPPLMSRVMRNDVPEK